MNQYNNYEWQANEKDLLQVVQLLEQSQIADSQKQKEIYSLFEQLSKNEDFYKYLSLIITLENHVTKTVRFIACATLKSQLNRNYHQISKPTIEYTKNQIVKYFGDNQLALRRSISNCITTIVTKGGFSEQNDLMVFLNNNLNETNNIIIIENTLDCISKIVEDMRSNSENFSFLDSDKGGQILDAFISKIIIFCNQNQNNKIKAKAFYCLNLFIYSMPPSLANNIQQYLSLLIQETQNNSVDVAIRAIQGISAIQEMRKDIIMSQIIQVIEHLVNATSNQNYEVRKQASLFWYDFLYKENDEGMERINYLSKYLQSLVPLVFKNIVYEQEDLMNLFNDETFLESYKDDEQNQEEKDNDNEDFFNNGEYTLRKLSGLILTTLSTDFKDVVFNYCQQLISDYFMNTADWKMKECAISALGAISEGCRNSVQPFLPQIIQTLLGDLNNEQPLIVSISLWCLRKYSQWIFDNNAGELYLTNLFNCILSNNQQIQGSACSSLSKLIDDFNYFHYFEPILDKILIVLKSALEKYQGSSLFQLFNTILCLSKNFENQLKNGQQINILLPVLKQKWDSYNTTDQSIYPLLECIVEISYVFEQNFCYELFPKCMVMIKNYIMELASQNQNKKTLYIKKEIVLRVIDILSAFLDKLKDQFDGLIQNSNLYDYFIQLQNDQNFQIREFLFSFFGEVAMYCPNGFTQYVPMCIEPLVKNIFLLQSEFDPGNSFKLVCNNAVMCLTQFSMAYPQIMSQYVNQIAQKIIGILKQQKVHVLFAQNLTQSIGRLAVVNREAIAPLLNDFYQFFCLANRNATDSNEKFEAFQGILQIIANSQWLVQNKESFIYIVDAFLSIEQLQNNSILLQSFIQCFSIYKQSVTQQEINVLFGQLENYKQIKLNSYIQSFQ